MIAPYAAPGVMFGDLIPTLTTAGTTAGTLRLSVGLYRLTAEEHGYIGNGPVDGHGPFPLWYTRKR